MRNWGVPLGELNIYYHPSSTPFPVGEAYFQPLHWMGLHLFLPYQYPFCQLASPLTLYFCSLLISILKCSSFSCLNPWTSHFLLVIFLPLLSSVLNTSLKLVYAWWEEMRNRTSLRHTENEKQNGNSSKSFPISIYFKWIKLYNQKTGWENRF